MKVKSVKYYDLHICNNKPEAMVYLNNILNDWKKAEVKYEFEIVTGQGIHSRNGPVLRPLTIDLLKSEQFRFSDRDPGAVYVYGKLNRRRNNFTYFKY